MATIRTSVVVSFLFTFFGGPALVLVAMPWFITHFQIPARESRAQMFAAAALMGIGLMPLLESIVRFVVVGRGTLMPAVPTEHLVVTGLYRYTRNPMYTGVIIALLGEALLFRCLHMLVYIAFVWLIMHLFVCFYEEPTLRATFAVDFPRFRQNVPRWFPRLRAWNDRGFQAGK